MEGRDCDTGRPMFAKLSEVTKYNRLMQTEQQPSGQPRFRGRGIFDVTVPWV